MTDAQPDEFEAFISQGDEDDALAWLEARFSDYKTVVREELQNQLEVIDRSADLLVAADG